MIITAHQKHKNMIQAFKSLDTSELLDRIASFEEKVETSGKGKRRDFSNHCALLLMHNELNERLWQKDHPPNQGDRP